jgi:hypothetical protein
MPRSKDTSSRNKTSTTWARNKRRTSAGQVDDRYVDATPHVKSHQQDEHDADIGFLAFDEHLLQDAMVFSYWYTCIYTCQEREADVA